jgi:hypothetical protein
VTLIRPAANSVCDDVSQCPQTTLSQLVQNIRTSPVKTTYGITLFETMALQRFQSLGHLTAETFITALPPVLEIIMNKVRSVYVRRRKTFSICLRFIQSRCQQFTLHSIEWKAQ